MRPCLQITLGAVRYAAASRLQEALVQARRRGDIPDVLLLLEHPPVVTIGRGDDGGGLLAAPEDLVGKGIEVHECARGGKVTYHGPGQLVGYPILDLSQHGRDLNGYLRSIERGLIAALQGFGVAAFRRPSLTGVWTERGKVAAIGIAVRHWVTFHGFALNVSCDLTPFDLIDPCGLGGMSVTSMSRELSGPITVEDVRDEVAACFAHELNVELLPGPIIASDGEVDATDLVNQIAAVRCS